MALWVHGLKMSNKYYPKHKKISEKNYVKDIKIFLNIKKRKGKKISEKYQNFTEEGKEKKH